MTIVGKPFLRIASPGALPDALRGGVVAIGNFDGVHRGHQAVLGEALASAEKLGRPALVLTFEPHPRAFFRPAEAPGRITPALLKARLMAALGFDAIIEQDFTAEFASRTAESFIADLLGGQLGARTVVTGYDFHFGKGRLGTPAMLAAAGGKHGFGVSQVAPFSDEGGNVISSSAIRGLLLNGDIGTAAGLMGWRPAFAGIIERGRQLGRTIGYPTANMRLPDNVPLNEGIYAVKFRRANGALLDGVASFGRRPTVTENGEPLLETFLFDFSGDLYGEDCTVSVVSRLRGEEKFDGLAPLVAQMKRDEAEARTVLSALQPLSPLDAAITFA